MKPDTFERYTQRIKAHEGKRLRLYADSKGFLTIGYGRCIQLNGIRDDEAELMLKNDLAQALDDCRAAFPAFDSFSDNRQLALAELMYQTGLKKLLAFRKMVAAVHALDWSRAGAEARDSEWFRHLERCGSRRGKEIVSMLERG